MKSKTTVFFGYITFLSLVLAGSLMLYVFYDTIIYKNIELGRDFKFDNFFLLLMILFSIYSGLHYVVSSRFWRTRSSRIEQIENENEILKREIEQNELKAKLSKLVGK